MTDCLAIELDQLQHLGRRISLTGRYFLLLLLVVGLVSCSPPPPPEGVLNISALSAPNSFNPVTARETSTTDITNQMFRGLTGVDGVTGEVYPELAVDWERKDGGRRWLFTLRRGLKWSDGTDLTVDDVLFSYNDLYLNFDIETSTRFALLMDGQPPVVEKHGPYQISFTYPEPYIPFLRVASAAIMPKHKFVGKTAAEINQAWGVNTPPEEIVVNGPFRLGRYDSEERVILERNLFYYKNFFTDAETLPRLEQLVFHVVPTVDLQVQRFLRGELDLLSVLPQFYPLVKAAEEEGNFAIERVGPTLGTLFLSFNMNTDRDPETGQTYIPEYKLEWFNDREFRRAVAYAIDREKIQEIVYNDLAQPQHGPVSAGNELFHIPDLKQYNYDPQRAREILDQAGYRDYNGDGIRQDPEGNQIRFVLLTNAGNDQRVVTSQIIRQDLANLGFRVGFNQVEFNTLVNQLSANFDWEAVVMGFTGGLEPHFGSNVWLSSGNLHLWHPFQESPVRTWEARIDELFARGVREPDDEKRREIYGEWQRIVNHQLPMIYTVNSEVIYAVNQRVKNARPTVTGGFTHNIEYITVN